MTTNVTRDFLPIIQDEIGVKNDTITESILHFYLDTFDSTSNPSGSQKLQGKENKNKLFIN